MTELTCSPVIPDSAIAESAPEDSKENWWRSTIARYEVPNISRSIRQLLNTLVPWAALIAVMTYTVHRSVLLTLLLGVPLAGLWVRIFIISHDCGHGSFFKSRKANAVWGAITSFLTLIPYRYWRMEHAKHHGASGNLDRRGTGDIWTMTVEEYRAASRWDKFKYRVYRSPIVLFLIGPFLLFAVLYRFTDGIGGKPEKRSVYITNVLLGITLAAGIYFLGIKNLLLIFIVPFALSTSLGVWLFYVQHQFEGVYWERDDNWSYLKQAMEGSSFYRLPKVLQWFSGNIGFHHIHHLSHRIPNYNLEECHYENDMFKDVGVITLKTSLKSATFRLWDEKNNRLVGFRAARG